MEPVAEAVDDFLADAQHELFNIRAELATPNAERHGMTLVQDADIARLEVAIDRWESELEPLSVFILPGGCPAAAQSHLRGACADGRSARS